MTNRLHHLDCYKGVCILFVIITHYARRMDYLFPYWIDMAVPVFMVITGYLYSIKLNGMTIREMYSPVSIFCKWLRFIIPFTPIIMIEIYIESHTKGNPIGDVIKTILINGGYGPGAYYFPIMIQVVIIVPIIFYLVNKFEFKGLVGVFIINVLYEIAKNIFHMSALVYRLIAFRYVFIIAYGCFLFCTEKRNRNRKEIALSCIVGIIGALYITMFEYMGMKPVITNQWSNTSVFAVLLIVPIMDYLLRKEQISNRLLELTGKASYNIFLVQLLYYAMFAYKVYEHVSIGIIRVIVNIVICVVVGIVYYKIEYPFTKMIVNAITKRERRESNV